MVTYLWTLHKLQEPRWPAVFWPVEKQKFNAHIMPIEIKEPIGFMFLLLMIFQFVKQKHWGAQNKRHFL